MKKVQSKESNKSGPSSNKQKTGAFGSALKNTTSNDDNTMSLQGQKLPGVFKQQAKNLEKVKQEK